MATVRANQSIITWIPRGLLDVHESIGENPQDQRRLTVTETLTVEGGLYCLHSIDH
jgi:hypothetical protein